jgi:uncharacterized protein YpmB
MKPGTRVFGRAGVFYADREAVGTVTGNLATKTKKLVGVRVDGEEIPVWVPEDSVDRVEELEAERRAMQSLKGRL